MYIYIYIYREREREIPYLGTPLVPRKSSGEGGESLVA